MRFKLFLIFLASKLVKVCLLLVVLSILSFWLVSKSPIDPVQAYIGADMMVVGPEQRENIAVYWGLDRPPLERLYLWGSALIKGDFGTSMIFRKPVISVIKERFTASLILMGLAWTISGLIGFWLGVLAAMKQGTLLDRLIKTYCFTLASTPTFWLGLLLLIVFAVWLGWFPIGLAVPAGVLAEEVGILDRLRHLILPALTLSILGVANIALHTRQKLIDILASEYVLLARARGATEREVLFRHGLRNIALPAITLQFASLSELFGGSVLAEQVFSYPGLGQATVQAGLRSDVPLLLGIVIFSALFVFTGNLLADIIYRLVDPRIRLREETQ
jgi:peptide/nickel transport system permease protein